MKLTYDAFRKTLAQVCSEAFYEHGLQVRSRAAELLLSYIYEDEKSAKETPKGALEIITAATVKGSSSENEFAALFAADNKFCPCTLRQALFVVPKLLKMKKTLSLVVWQGISGNSSTDVFVLVITTTDKKQTVSLDIAHNSTLTAKTNYLVRHATTV